MKIAIIGTGIAGLTAAHLLHHRHDITVYEAANYVGGHVNTIEVHEDHQSIAIDTGFIVFNDWTYPHFEKLLSTLDVQVQNSEMSFSAQCEATDFEWSGNGLRGLIFNKENWNQYKAYQILFDVLRFNKTAKEYLVSDQFNQTLGEFLTQNKFSETFIQNYLVPMGAAIWSSEPGQINEFPAKSFLAFFNHHGLLNIKDRPQWKTIVGGSKQYVKELTKPFINKIHLNTPVERIKRVAQRVEIFARGRKPEYFDHVFIACHSDQALKLLDQPTKVESNVLGNIRYQANTAVLHTDSSLMPMRKSAWSSWNYHITEQDPEDVKVTYYMNRLQNLSVNKDYFVTLNLDEKIDSTKIIKKINYSHPVFDHSAIKSQKQHTLVNGAQNTWYCGAYWRNGFHEDGVWSAIQSVEQFTTLVEHEELYLQRAS